MPPIDHDKLKSTEIYNFSESPQIKILVEMNYQEMLIQSVVVKREPADLDLKRHF